MNTKICKLCGIVKPINAYTHNKKGYPVSYCKPCASRYNSDSVKKRKITLIPCTTTLKDVFYIDNSPRSEKSQKKDKSDALLASGYITHRLWR